MNDFDNISIYKKAVPVSLYLALFFSYAFNPLLNTGITRFERYISSATAGNLDIGKVINNFYIWYLIIFPAIFFAALFLLKLIYKKAIPKGPQVMDAINNLYQFAVISLFPLLIAYINRFTIAKLIFTPSIVIPCVIIISIIGYIINSHLIELDFNAFKWCIFISFAMIFPVLIFLNMLAVKLPAYLLYFLVIMFTTALLYAAKKYLNKSNFDKIQIAFIPFAYTLAFVSIFLELCNILNQYGIFITRKAQISLAIYVIAIIISVAIFYTFKTEKINDGFCWEKYFYPGIVLSLGLIYVQPQLQLIVNTDLFESSNGGCAISQLFLFGKLPIIESFSGHMLSDTIWGVVYGILNNDSFGAIFSPYGVYAFVVVLFILYLILKNVFNRDFAAAVTILFPFIGGMAIWSDIGFFSILSLVYLTKKPTPTFSYFVFWSVLAISFLYRMDTGVAYGIGSLVVLILLCVLKKIEINYKKLVASFFAVTAIVICLFSIVCFIKRINIMHRIREFFAIGLSNQNWAYSSIGDPNRISFFYVYIFIPFITILALIYFILHIRNHSGISADKSAIILSLGFAYIINIPRIIVRHNLYEGLNGARLFTAALFLSLVVAFVIKRNKYILFAFGFFTFMAATSVISSDTNMYPQSLLSVAMNKFNNGALTTENIVTEKVKRIDTSEEMKKSYSAIVNKINELLSPGETYLDFSNQTLLYALSGRENPTYISQSPGHLSGEHLQLRFIEQIEAMKDRIPLAILPKNPVYLGFTLDGIQNSYRYYKVSEYIYNNYKPLGVISDYAIWCRKDKIRRYSSYDYIKPSIDISSETFEYLTVYDAQLRFNNKEIEITAGSYDPQVIGLEGLFGDNLATNAETEINIKYTSSVSGNVQLFYTRFEQEEFSEELSVRQTCQTQGILRFRIPLTPYSRIRLDVPDNSIFTIKEVSIADENQLVSAGYDYAKYEDAHIYYLGMIPYLWGKYDTEKAYENKIIDGVIRTENDSIIIESDKIPKNSGNYLLLRVTSDKGSSMTVFFGKDGQDGFEALNSFTFNVEKGQNNYLVRVSSDFYWYSGMINSCKLSLFDGVLIDELQILEGD